MRELDNLLDSPEACKHNNYDYFKRVIYFLSFLKIKSLITISAVAVNGMSRMLIVAYFNCFKPEPKCLRHLPPLAPVEEEEEFLNLLSTLPKWLRVNIKKLYARAKSSFCTV